VISLIKPLARYELETSLLLDGREIVKQSVLVAVSQRARSGAARGTHRATSVKERYKVA